MELNHSFGGPLSSPFVSGRGHPLEEAVAEVEGNVCGSLCIPFCFAGCSVHQTSSGFGSVVGPAGILRSDENVSEGAYLRQADSVFHALATFGVGIFGEQQVTEVIVGVYLGTEAPNFLEVSVVYKGAENDT